MNKFFALVILFSSYAQIVVGQQSHSWNQPPSAQVLEDIEELEHESFRSETMKATVGFCIVLPPTYREDQERRYPVVYWLHGGGGNECSDLWNSKAWRRLQRDKTIGEVILVYPNGGRSSYWDHYDGKVMLESMIVKELIPHVDKKFRTIATRKGRAVHGFSMGASGALKFAVKYPELFSAAVAYGGGAVDLEKTDLPLIKNILKRNLNSEPALIRQNNTYRILNENQSEVRKLDVKFLQICGSDDPWISSARNFRDALNDCGIESELIVVPKTAHELGKLIESGGATAAKFQDAVFHGG